MIGSIVGHYKILEKLGEGGMGVVYRAEDVRLGRHVAVKFLSAELAKDTTALERFQREARAASSINHPHICTLHDIGRYEGRPYLVLELLEGQTLRERLAGARLPTDVLVDYGVQIADALDAAHSRGIIHRDIKSANIFVTPRGQVKVLDFGLAKLAAHAGIGPGAHDLSIATAAPTNHATGGSQTLGTISFMSPEQARGEDLDARSDLFSFGVVLYEMATGVMPFTGRTTALVFEAILHGAPDPPSVRVPHVPHELERIIDKALEKDRELRYQTAAELRADLKRLKRETDSARDGLQTTATAVVRPRRARITPAVLTAIATLVLAIGAFAGYRALRSTSAIDSVAVLPFTASGAGSDTEYLTDGISETLINSLSQVSGLRVSARSLVFRYKGHDYDPQKAGHDLGVKAVITGRVAVRGGRLVVQADLMDVANGSQLWGGQYNKPMAEILNVQDDIAADIFEKLRLRLTGEDKRRATKRFTDNPEAYQLYLQGRYHWNQGTLPSSKKAIEFFQRAIEKDPNYAVAYTGLADAYLLLGSYWVETIPEAKAAAERAIALDPSLAEAHVALGHIKLWLDWDWAAAEREFEQGITLNATSALAHTEYALYLATLGRATDAIAEATRAQDLDPQAPAVNADVGWCLLFAGRTDEAIAQFQKTLDLDQNSLAAHQGLGAAYAEAGRMDDAVAELSRALTLSENSPIVMGHLGFAQAHRGGTDEARKTLSELRAMSDRAYVPSSAIALILAALGDKGGALTALERAYDEHDFAIVQLRAAPWFRSLRGDPRYERLIARLSLPEVPGRN